MNQLTAEQIIGALHRGREDAMRRSGTLLLGKQKIKTQEPKVGPRVRSWINSQLLPGDKKAIERYIAGEGN